MCCWWLIWPIQNDAKTRKIIGTLAHGYSSESTQRFGQYKMMQKNRKIIGTLAHGYSSESAQRYLTPMNKRRFLIFFYPCPLDKSSLSIRKVNGVVGQVNPSNAKATFVQSTPMQRFLKTIQTLSCWYSLESSR